MTTPELLLVVALKTDQPNIERRLKATLAVAEPIDTDTQPLVWAKPVEELVAADLDALRSLLKVDGWPDAVSRLGVGDVVSGGASYPLAGTGSGDAPDSPDTDSPRDSMWNLRSLAECVLAAPQDRGINVGLARDLARAALATADAHV